MMKAAHISCLGYVSAGKRVVFVTMLNLNTRLNVLNYLDVVSVGSLIINDNPAFLNFPFINFDTSAHLDLEFNFLLLNQIGGLAIEN